MAAMIQTVLAVIACIMFGVGLAMVRSRYYKTIMVGVTLIVGAAFLALVVLTWQGTIPGPGPVILTGALAGGLSVGLIIDR